MLSKAIVRAAAGNAAGEGLYVEEVFSTYLYDGTGSSLAITNDIDLDGEGGFTWFKGRNDSTFHVLMDTERGGTKWLRSDSSNAESTVSPAWITYNSDGFTLPVNVNGLNNTQRMVSWTFRKAPKFFDVVTYTGTGSVQNISHNLGSVPGCIMVKRRDAGADWKVFHRSIGNTKWLELNTTSAEQTAIGLWNNTTPTSTVFTVGTDSTVNASGGSFVAYLFAHNDGDGDFGESGDQDIIKCGSYTGNGGTTGPQVDLGFEPQWIIVKGAGPATGRWWLFDNMRGIPGAPGIEGRRIFAEIANDEGDGNELYITSTGFSAYGGTSTTLNTSGNTYVYIAIRRGPMKTPESGTDVYYYATQDDTSPGHEAPVPNWPVDFAIKTKTSSEDNRRAWTRLLGEGFLIPNSTDAFSSNADYSFDYQNGFFESTVAYSDRFAWMFRRAPGFFDVVAYEGDGVAGRTVDHNLGVVPELIIVKSRSTSYNWFVYASGVGNTAALSLNQVSAPSTSTTYWNDTDPTDTNFSLGTFSQVNGNGSDFIAYLFATVPGVSKVGSYTGTGTGDGDTLNIDCGFSAGARFVLIKRTDTSGNWTVYDTERGINASADDNRLELNGTGAEDTNENTIEPLASGFTVRWDTDSSASNNPNVNNATYIFLAIA